MKESIEDVLHAPNDSVRIERLTSHIARIRLARSV